MATKVNTPEINVEDAIAFQIHRIARVVRRHFLHLARTHGFDLTPEQWFVLNKVYRNNGCSQTDLADAVFGDRPNLTRILKRMAAAGWVARKACPDDGRRVRIWLTDEGRALHERFAQMVADVRPDAFQGIDPADAAATQRVFAALERNMT